MRFILAFDEFRFLTGPAALIPWHTSRHQHCDPSLPQPSAAKANGGGSDADKELERRKADCLKMVEMFEAVWPVVPADQRKEMPRMVAAKFPDLLKDLPKVPSPAIAATVPDVPWCIREHVPCVDICLGPFCTNLRFP